MKPAEFAAQLISRLESLKRKRDTISSLEERLQQIQEVGAFSAEVFFVLPPNPPQPLVLFLFYGRRRSGRRQTWCPAFPSSLLIP